MLDWLRTAALTVCLAATGCASSTASLPLLPSTAINSYKLGPGDELRIGVYGVDPLSNTYVVGDTGTISLPLIEPLPVAGKTVREAEASVADAIRKHGIVLDPKVSAQVQTYRPFFILGEVQRPGQYPYVPGMSLVTAVSVAGGYTFRADTKNAVITRDSAQARAQQSTPVLPGDVINVPEGWF